MREETLTARPLRSANSIFGLLGKAEYNSILKQVPGKTAFATPSPLATFSSALAYSCSRDYP